MGVSIEDLCLDVANLPTEEGLFTVIQLIVRGKPVLVFGLNGHAATLEDYLSSHGIPFAYTFDEEFRAFGIEQKVPYVKGRDYELVGAGQALVYVEDKRVELGGVSLGYGIGINEEHLHDVSELCKDWRFENVEDKF